jgi:luciferase family oxidoreductase group 1
MAEAKSTSIPFSILDVAAILQGRTIADSFHDSLAAAQQAERLGYTRYWLAEHHNSESIASAATSVLIGYIAQGTTTIRVGSGGIMLPNHSPYIIAEQFGTLETLYPKRIDLGLGRAPGTDQLTAQAIGRQHLRVEEFPNDIRKLQTYFSKENSASPVRAIPGEGSDVRIWVLGSSPDSARLAASMGLPYAFASHFAPTYLLQAIDLYRNSFRPSASLSKPYVMAAANVVVADTDEQANYLLTSLLQLLKGVISGKRLPLQPPVDDMNADWDDLTRQAVYGMLTYSFVGRPERVREQVNAFIQKTGLDEIMITSNIYDQKARLKSMQLFSELMN